MLKANNVNANFPTQLHQVEEVLFKKNVYDFSADYDAIDKSDILNICMHLTIKNKLKYCCGLLNKCLLNY